MSWINRKSYNRNSDREKSYPFARWTSWLFLAASIFILIFIYYRAEMTLKATSNDRYMIFYIISIAGIFFWAIVLRLRKNLQLGIVTIAISILIGAYIVESALTFLSLGSEQFQTNNNKLKAATELGQKYDTRQKLDIINAMKAQGLDVVPLTSPSMLLRMSKSKNFDFLPLGGVSKKITLGSNEMGYYMTYNSDRYGFNNPDAEWDSPNLEWLLTGDSYAEGVAVNPGEDIAGQLRLITHQPVITLGKAGNGPLLELAAISEYAPSLQPKKVLWVYFEGNDLINLQNEKQFYLLMKYLQEGFSQNLMNHQKEADTMLYESLVNSFLNNTSQWINKTRWFRLVRLRNILKLNNINLTHRKDTASSIYDDDVVIDKLFSEILIKSRDRVDAFGGKLYFVYLPTYKRYIDKSIKHDQFLKKSEVLDLVRNLNIPVIEIHQDVFFKSSNPLTLFPFGLDGHYNPDGYREVAKAIITSVNKYEQSNK